MKNRDRWIVAGVLAVGLVVGLALVSHFLDQAQAKRQDLLNALWVKEEGAVAPPAWTPTETDPLPEESAPPDTGALPEETVPPTGDGGEAGSAGSGEEGGSGTSGAPETSGGSGEASPDLGTPPVLAAGEVTLESLTTWMQTESSGALAAQTALAAENAIAAGVGSADDAQRRAFAETQAPANQEARLNALAEQASSLCLEYLRCRDVLALEEENLVFYQGLNAMVQAEQGADDGSDTGRTQLLADDAAAIREALSQAELAVETARVDLQSAVQALCEATGNASDAEITVSGELTPVAMPDITEAAAVTAAQTQRNEVKAAQRAITVAEQKLLQLRYQYPTTAPEYLEQQAVLEAAQADYPKAQTAVAGDVKERLARLQVSQTAIDQAEAVLEETGTAAPKPVYALEQGTDGGAWSSNRAVLTAQWQNIYTNRAALINETAQFNQAVLEFQHAMGVGCTAAEI